MDLLNPANPLNVLNPASPWCWAGGACDAYEQSLDVGTVQAGWDAPVWYGAASLSITFLAATIALASLTYAIWKGR